MAKSSTNISTSSFIHTFALDTQLYQGDILSKRLNAARELYNLSLSEMFKRESSLKHQKTYRKAISLYKECKLLPASKLNRDKISLLKKEYTRLFKLASKVIGFTEFDMHRYMTGIRTPAYNHLIDANTAQKIASKAFKSVSDWHYKNSGRPRFKAKGQIRSVEGKNNAAGIRFVDGKLSWNKLIIPVKYDLTDKYNIEAHALNSKVKYCRVVPKRIRGKDRYFLQLILEGTPLIKPKHTKAFKKANGKVVGIDLGPQTIAYVSKSKSGLEVLASDIDRLIKDKTKIQRQLSRKLRVNNPDNFEETVYVKNNKHYKKKLGKVKNRTKSTIWIKSKIYINLKETLADLERVHASRRKELHNRLINELLCLGNNFKMEKISYSAWSFEEKLV